MPARRIAVPLAAAAVAAGAVAALHGHATPIAGRARHVPVLKSGLELRDLPTAVSVPHRRVHDPMVRTPVPVLMYHAIGTPPVGAPFPELFVAASLFRAQMAALAESGYHAVTLDRVWQAWHGRARLPHKPVVLSFDDGYRGDFGVAMPALRRRGWPAVLNLVVANLHRHDWGLRTWMVQRMVKNGWEIASHTLTHPDLDTLSPGRLWREVHGSRLVLQRLFHVPVDFFCYPYGDFDAAVVAAVRRTGYFGATTTLPGLAQPSQPDTLRRVRVAGGEPPASLLAMIAAA